MAHARDAAQARDAAAAARGFFTYIVKINSSYVATNEARSPFLPLRVHCYYNRQRRTFEMSRDDEDRILHGLYYYREDIDQQITVSGDQILWLAMHPLRDGEDWDKEGQPQSLDTSTFPPDVQSKLLTAKLELPLRYLQYRRLITCTRGKDATFAVAVTFAGADRAIRLHTHRGRMDLWYREHWDGMLGLMTTALVAFVTALIAVVLLR